MFNSSWIFYVYKEDKVNELLISYAINMKKYAILNLLCLLTIGTSFGQITYTSSSFPQVGDILSISTAIDSGVVVTAPSATATTWDFSQLVALNTNKDTIQPASSGANFAMFPSTDILQPLIGQIGTAYTDVTSTQIERMGGGFEIMGISFVNAYTNTHVTQIVPLTYNDVASDTYASRFSQHIDSIPFLRQLLDSLVGGLPLNISPDSIRIAIDGDENRVVDAWGTCIMADSIYDVIRQKIVTNFTLKLEVSIMFPLGGSQWIDVSNFIQLPIPTSGTTVQYNFLAEGVKQPVVSLMLDSAETVITNIEFLDTIVNNPPTGIRYLENTIRVKMFPNPAKEQVNIQVAATDIPEEGYNLSIIDLLGRTVLTTSNIHNENYTIHTTSIVNGQYIVVLYDNAGQLLQRKKLEIRQ